MKKKQEVIMLKLEIAAQKEANEPTLILEYQLELSEQALAALDTIIAPPDIAIKAAFDVVIKSLERIYIQMVALEEQFQNQLILNHSLPKPKITLIHLRMNYLISSRKTSAKKKLSEIKK